MGVKFEIKIYIKILILKRNSIYLVNIKLLSLIWGGFVWVCLDNYIITDKTKMSCKKNEQVLYLYIPVLILPNISVAHELFVLPPFTHA